MLFSYFNETIIDFEVAEVIRGDILVDLLT